MLFERWPQTAAIASVVILSRIFKIRCFNQAAVPVAVKEH